MSIIQHLGESTALALTTSEWFVFLVSSRGDISPISIPCPSITLLDIKQPTLCLQRVGHRVPHGVEGLVLKETGAASVGSEMQKIIGFIKQVDNGISYPP